MKKILAFVLLGVFFALHFMPAPAAADGNGEVKGEIVKRIKKGRNYIGGYCPWLKKMQIVKEVYSGGKYYYLQKATIKRASGDVNANGRFTIFNAATYYKAFKKLNKEKRYLIETLGGIETLFRVTKTTPFPPVQLKYMYAIQVFDLNGSLIVSGLPGENEKRDKRWLIKSLKQGLQPGKYKLYIDSWVEMLPHPLQVVLDIWDIIDTAISLAQGDIAGALGIDESIAKEILLHAIKLRVTETDEEYYLHVPAKLPKLKGMQWQQAQNQLLARNLGYKLVTNMNCNPANYGLITNQSHASGRFYKAGTQVVLTVCKATVAPTPTSNSSGQGYGVFAVPCPHSYSNLFVGSGTQLANMTYSAFNYCGSSGNKITNASRLASAVNLASAEQALCGGVTGSGYFSGAKYYIWGGSSRYWGGHSSVQAAMTHYCPGER